MCSSPPTPKIDPFAATTLQSLSGMGFDVADSSMLLVLSAALFFAATESAA